MIIFSTVPLSYFVLFLLFEYKGPDRQVPVWLKQVTYELFYKIL